MADKRGVTEGVKTSTSKRPGKHAHQNSDKFDDTNNVNEGNQTKSKYWSKQSTGAASSVKIRNKDDSENFHSLNNQAGNLLLKLKKSAAGVVGSERHERVASKTTEDDMKMCRKGTKRKMTPKGAVVCKSVNDDKKYVARAVKCVDRRDDPGPSTSGAQKYVNPASMCTSHGAESTDSESDSEWEEVEDLPGSRISEEQIVETVNKMLKENNDSKDTTVEVIIEGPSLMKKRKKIDMNDWLRQQMNKIKRKTQLDVHKVHLLCLIVNDQKLNSVCNDELLQAVALSLVPAQTLDNHKPSQWRVYNLKMFLEWYSTLFMVDHAQQTDMSQLDKCLFSRLEEMKVSELQLVLLCVTMCRALGLLVRLMHSLQPVTHKAADLKQKTDIPESAIISVSSDEEETKLQSVKTSSSSPADLSAKHKCVSSNSERKTQTLSTSNLEPSSSNAKLLGKHNTSISKGDGRKEISEIKTITGSTASFEPSSSKAKLLGKHKTGVSKGDKRKEISGNKKITGSTASLEPSSSEAKDSGNHTSKRDKREETSEMKKVTSKAKLLGKHKTECRKNEIVKKKKASGSNTNLESLSSSANVSEKHISVISKSDSKKTTADIKKAPGSTTTSLEPPSSQAKLLGKQKTVISKSERNTETGSTSSLEPLSSKAKLLGEYKNVISKSERKTQTLSTSSLEPSSSKAKSLRKHKTAISKDDRKKKNTKYSTGSTGESLKVSKHFVKSHSKHEDKFTHKHRPKRKSDVSYVEFDSNDEAVDIIQLDGPSERKGKKRHFGFEDKQESLERKKGKTKKTQQNSAATSEANRCDYWCEVYLEQEKRWVCVDCVGNRVNQPKQVEMRVTQPISYVLAYHITGYVKDKTSVYASEFLSETRKLRPDADWWRETIGIWGPYTDSDRTNNAIEDVQMQDTLKNKPMPKSINDFKSHPLYALKRHLLKFDAIYPDTSIPLGYIKGEPIYARECVHTLHSRQNWMKEGRLVKMNEDPYKMVKSRKICKTYGAGTPQELLTELYGYWQTELYIPPPAIDGKVPRNEYGNVELFMPSMLPPGTVHLKLPGLNRIAKKLDLDCAPAMVGWEQVGRFATAKHEGFVVCIEHQEVLEAAWEEDRLIQLQKEAEKRQARVVANWKLLIRGLLVRERMKAKFKLQDLTEPDICDGEEQEQATDAAQSWPRNMQENSTKTNKKKSRNTEAGAAFPFEMEQL